MSSVSHCSVPQAGMYKFGVSSPNLNFLSCFKTIEMIFLPAAKPFVLEQSTISIALSRH